MILDHVKACARGCGLYIQEIQTRTVWFWRDGEGVAKRQHTKFTDTVLEKGDQSEFPLRVTASLSEPLRGHGGAGPGEHQPVGPVRVPLGAAEARLVRRGVHHAQVRAGSRTAQLPLGFPEGRRSDHGHRRGAGEENTCCIDCAVVRRRTAEYSLFGVICARVIYIKCCLMMFYE